MPARSNVEHIVEAVHATPAQLVIYLTGGGAQVISDLLSVPGASGTVLEAQVPYARESLIDLLGIEPSKYVSEQTAVSLAQAAYKRAANISTFGAKFVGLGCTAGLSSVTPRRGPHNAYIACHTGTSTATVSLDLAKGLRTRRQEEELVARAVLCLIAEHTGAHAALPSDRRAFLGLADAETWRQSSVACEGGADPVRALLEGRVSCVEITGDVVTVDAPRHRHVYLAGSFNPLHDGHQGLLRSACQLLKRPDAGCFELCVNNADKGTLGVEEVTARVAQFRERGLPVVLTRASLFTDKVRLFRGATFVLGYDTAVRIVMPKYYNNSDREMERQFAEFNYAGSRFVVAGRWDERLQKFLTLQDIQLPEWLQAMDLFDALPEAMFRNDISSTKLRRQLVKSG